MQISEQEVEELVEFLKVLADRNRLRIMGMLGERERTVKEMAAELGVTEPTVSWHLGTLGERGMVAMEARGTSHYYRLRQESVYAFLKLLKDKATDEMVLDPNSTKFEQQVLKTFFKNGRLTTIPVKHSKRLVILKRLAREFRYGEFYSELQINDTLMRFHEDYASLRRYLIDNRLMARKDGQYWRLDIETPPTSLPVGAGSAE